MTTPENMTSDELRDFYREDYVQKYRLKDKGVNRRRIDQMAKFFDLSSSDDVIDFACGNGLLLDYLFDSVRSYTGIDFSSEFIADAETRRSELNASNANFVCGDIVKFAAENRSRFDCGFALDFSEHVYDDDFIEIANAMRKTLKPEGRLILHTPNANFILEVLKEAGIMKQFPEHVAVRTPEANIQLMKRAGFTDVSCIFLPHYLSAVRWLHLFRGFPLVGRYCRARLLLACR